MDPSIPRLLGPGGRFAVRRLLGSGAFSDVLLADDRQGHMAVAIKLLKSAPRRSAMRERLRLEFATLARLEHPNLVRHYQLFEEPDSCFFTMEVVDGADWLSHLRPDLGRANPERARFVPCTADALGRLRHTLPQVVAGLCRAHEAGLVHGDLKPDNVRVTYAGRAVVLDYGLGALMANADHGDPVGTPAYMAPEQWEQGACTPASDWYALGVVLFQALTGALPFVGTGEQVLLLKRTVNAPRPSSVTSRVPAELDQLCVDLMQTRPEQRPIGVELIRRLRIVDETR